MNYEEIIEDLEQPYNEWFLHEKVFKGELKIGGWKLLHPKPINELHHEFNKSKFVITNPNFYEDGWILAESRRSVIMASGIKTEFVWDGKVWTSFSQLFKEYGPEMLNLFPELNWNETKEWIIVDKKSNKLLAQFDYWDDAPTRKDVE